MFAINVEPERPRAKSEGLGDFGISMTDGQRAERMHRQIIEAIEACETPEHVAEYMEAETLVLDGFAMNFPEYLLLIEEAADNQRIWTQPRPDAPCQAAPDNPTAHNGNTTKEKTNMFDIDTGGGSEGPFISWSARGTQDGAIPAKNFKLRDNNGSTVFENFGQGVVLDLDSLKVGWCFSEGIAGKAPDWKWWPNPNTRIEKPTDEHKWGISMRCAIGGGEAATWEDSGAATRNAIKELLPLLQSRPDATKLPMVKMVGVKDLKFTRGSTNCPLFEVVHWVDRPACLTAGAAIDVATDPAPQQTQQAPAPTPAPAESVPADASF